MTLAIGGLVFAALLALLFGALTGRVQLRSCCAHADPSKDLRMREAFQPDDDSAAS